ncbi:transmembrane channel-like protein 6 isoform X2 [Bombina bombina]|uniref:transmembrane channel-like protein 6 isoform X2 n=1 Tax=Bombina bombina TaxID=8345 RepID=UPI00235AD491|nr:transmembrane channel-like protein 6 isoform X2 [Bombina bombina]
MSVTFCLDDLEVETPCDEREVHNSFSSVIHDAENDAAMELQQLHNAKDDDWTQNDQSDQYSATMRILSNMPSRTIGRCRGAALSEYYNRTVRKRRGKKRPSVYNLQRTARPSLRCSVREQEAEDEQQRLLVSELQKTSGTQRSRLLKSFPLSLNMKRELRQLTMEDDDAWRQRRSNTCCSWLHDNINMACHHCWMSFLAGLYALRPWHISLKQIGGRFGSSVLSYFLFLKTLLAFNIFLCLLCVLFIVTPQAIYPQMDPNPRTFTGMELLTGAGYFSGTVMYYGYYSNVTLNDRCSGYNNSSLCPSGIAWLPYNMPLAYLFSTAVALLSTCIILVYRMSRSFGESFRVGFLSCVFAVKIFTCWDFKVTQNRSVQREKENVHMRLKELLSDQMQCESSKEIKKKLQTVCIHLLAWILCVASWLGSALAMFLLSEYLHKDYRGRMSWSEDHVLEAMLLPLPIAVSSFNLVLPYMYRALSQWEKLNSPVLEVYVAICRNLMLKLVVLGVLCYHWLVQKAKHLENKCWETFVGQELYRFIIMDFAFTILDTLFGELLWRIILQKYHKSKCRPEFDIARNVLELIYGQTLVWLGLLFCPLLPVVQIVKLLILFYIKKASLLRNCKSPSKPWRASHMSTIFLILLCFPSFLGAAIFLSYTMWSVKPSDTCGPFRSLDTMHEAGKIYVRQLAKSNPQLVWLNWIHHYLVENTFFIFLTSGVLIIVIYFYFEVLNGQRKIINLLKEQIANEGADKCFLIKRLHSVYEKKSRAHSHQSEPLTQQHFNSRQT